MTEFKSPVQLTALVFLFIFSSTTLAAEAVKNENNRTSETISNAELADHTGSDVESTINTTTNTTADHQQNFISDTQYFQQREERRRQMQEAQLEAYKQFLQNRKQYTSVSPYLPADAQARREEHIKNMEQRRELMDSMMEQHRKAAEERRNSMRLKMHQTSTTPAMAEKNLS